MSAIAKALRGREESYRWYHIAGKRYTHSYYMTGAEFVTDGRLERLKAR